MNSRDERVPDRDYRRPVDGSRLRDPIARRKAMALLENDPSTISGLYAGAYLAAFGLHDAFAAVDRIVAADQATFEADFDSPHGGSLRDDLWRLGDALGRHPAAADRGSGIALLRGAVHLAECRAMRNTYRATIVAHCDAGLAAFEWRAAPILAATLLQQKAFAKSTMPEPGPYKWRDVGQEEVARLKALAADIPSVAMNEVLAKACFNLGLDQMNPAIAAHDRRQATVNLAIALACGTHPRIQELAPRRLEKLAEAGFVPGE